MSQQLQQGAKAAINQCLNVQNDDRLIIVTDNESLEVGKALEQEAKNATANTLLLVIEDFAPRPATQIPQAILDKIHEFKPTVSIYAAQGKKGELPVFRRPLVSVFFKKYKCRHAHMIGITRQLMEDGMNKNYDLAYKVTHAVYNKAKNATEIKVTDPYGTDITFLMDPQNLKWVPSDGKITQDKWQNLPSGETFTAPKSADGVIVAWVLGDNLSEKYGVLTEPLKVTILDGYIIKVEGPENAKQDFEEYVAQYPDGNRVGELGIGTLIGLDHFIGNLLQDEKYPGVHVAFGHPYPDETGATWDAPSHIDIIAKDTTITFVYNDGKHELIMRDGKYTDEILED